MLEAYTPADALVRHGGQLCLDFTNTVSWHASAQPVEHLRSYLDLVRWSVAVSAVSAQQGVHLLDEAARQPILAEDILVEAKSLREALYRVFREPGPPAESDLATIQAAWHEAVAHQHLRSEATGYAVAWDEGDQSLRRVLWPVALNAVTLLTSPDVDRVRLCRSDGCGWLFLDTSRGGQRRWCSMEGCGNRAKARRHRQRVS